MFKKTNFRELFNNPYAVVWRPNNRQKAKEAKEYFNRFVIHFWCFVQIFLIVSSLYHVVYCIWILSLVSLYEHVSGLAIQIQNDAQHFGKWKVLPLFSCTSVYHTYTPIPQKPTVQHKERIFNVHRIVCNEFWARNLKLYIVDEITFWNIKQTLILISKRERERVREKGRHLRDAALLNVMISFRWI